MAGTVYKNEHVYAGLGSFTSGSPGSGSKMSFGLIATTTLSALSGASVTATNLIPAGTFVFGVLARVITTVTGAASTNIGDGTTANLFGAAVANAAGTTTIGTNFLSTFTPKLYVANTSVVLTAVTSNYTAGAIKLEVYGYNFTAIQV